jgi:hypothetical protein
MEKPSYSRMDKVCDVITNVMIISGSVLLLSFFIWKSLP